MTKMYIKINLQNKCFINKTQQFYHNIFSIIAVPNLYEFLASVEYKRIKNVGESVWFQTFFKVWYNSRSSYMRVSQWARLHVHFLSFWLKDWVHCLHETLSNPMWCLHVPVLSIGITLWHAHISICPVCRLLHLSTWSSIYSYARYF